MNRIAVLGLGLIGNAWAKNLHEDGLAVRAWNRTPKPQLPYFEPDPAVAVRDAELVQIVVADPPAVSGILDAIVPHLKPGQLVAQSSTISAEWTKTFAARVQAAGADFLEAPFTGGEAAALARKTVFYLGGAPEVIARAEPVLARLSAHRLVIGGIGSASSLKLAMNLNIAILAEALSEAFRFARAAGISGETFTAALAINSSRSGVADMKTPKLVKGDFSTQFSLKHMNKDLRLALESAGALDLPALKAVKSIYDKGMEKGWGDDDFIGLLRLWDDAKK